MLTGCDDSPLVMDKLCDQTRGQYKTVGCFYFDSAARKEQTATSRLGSILKQVISGTEKAPENIWRGLQEQKKAVSGRKLQPGDTAKIRRLITSSQPKFMVVNAVDENTVMQRVRLFDSLKEVQEKSPGARILVTGRPYICPEIKIRLAERATSISSAPTRDNTIGFLRVKLSEDETPEAMDSGLGVDVLGEVPGSILEVWLL